MWANIKLYFKYILLYSSLISLKSNLTPLQDSCIFVPNKSIYFLILHLRLSSLFYTCTLVDIFSYQSIYSLPASDKPYRNITVYNFHSLKNLDRLFLFSTHQSPSDQDSLCRLTSIETLYASANWLERETFELSGVFFYTKQDTRNLLLQYGDLTKPFRKHVPSIGYSELNFDLNRDKVVTIPLSSQF